jgi:hypothetical protein
MKKEREMAYKIEFPAPPRVSPTQKIPVVAVVNGGNGTEEPAKKGQLLGVLIDSPIVGPVWFALDDGWSSGDQIPVFYTSELPHLQKMSPEELRRRYEQKVALAGGWIRETKGFKGG